MCWIIIKSFCQSFFCCLQCWATRLSTFTASFSTDWEILITGKRSITRNHLWSVNRRLLDPEMPEDASKEAMRTPATPEKANNAERPAVAMTALNIPLVNEVQLTAATGGAELSCYRCTIPFGVVVLIAGIVVTAVAYSFNSHGSTISYFGLVLLSAGLLLLASSAICWKVRLERKKERRRESQTALVANQRSIFTWSGSLNNAAPGFLSLKRPDLDTVWWRTSWRQMLSRMFLQFRPVKAPTLKAQNSKLYRHCEGFICQTDVEHLVSWEHSQKECITIKMNYHCAEWRRGSLPLIGCWMCCLWLQREGLWFEKVQNNDSRLIC